MPFDNQPHPIRAGAGGRRAPVEVDIDKLAPGDMMVVEWRGKAGGSSTARRRCWPPWPGRTRPGRPRLGETSNSPTAPATPISSVKPEYPVAVGVTPPWAAPRPVPSGSSPALGAQLARRLPVPCTAHLRLLPAGCFRTSRRRLTSRCRPQYLSEGASSSAQTTTATRLTQGRGGFATMHLNIGRARPGPHPVLVTAPCSPC